MRRIIAAHIIEVAVLAAIIVGVIVMFITEQLSRDSLAALISGGFVIATFVSIVFGPLGHMRQD